MKSIQVDSGVIQLYVSSSPSYRYVQLNHLDNSADAKVHPKLRRNEIDPEQNMGTLLMEFFELYGKHFNYDEVGISIRKGGFYYSKRSRGWYRGGQAYLLSVEDPQDPGTSDLIS
jgi:DNA polymerase sigma